MNIEELNKRLATVEAENATLQIVAKMADVEKAYYDTLSDAEKKAFEGMDEAGRKAKMGDKFKKSLSGDQVEAIEKQLTEIQKAADAAKVEIAKRDETIAKQTTEIEKLKGDVETAAIRAEVEKNFPLTKGTIEEKVAILKAVKALPEDVRKSVLDGMTQVEKSLADLAKEKGTSETDIAKDANEKIAVIAKGLKAADSKLSDAQAFTKAIQTPEGKKLYAETRK